MIVSGVVVDGGAELVEEGADAAFDFVADDDVAGSNDGAQVPAGR
jgi:hypothetical protein